MPGRENLPQTQPGPGSGRQAWLGSAAWSWRSSCWRADAAAGAACDGCPPLPDLLARYERAGGRHMVCPVCFNAKLLEKGDLLPNAELAGSVQLWEWIGDGATTFSY
jgi:hypothetical protein